MVIAGADARVQGELIRQLRSAGLCSSGTGASRAAAARRRKQRVSEIKPWSSRGREVLVQITPYAPYVLPLEVRKLVGNHRLGAVRERTAVSRSGQGRLKEWLRSQTL